MSEKMGFPCPHCQQPVHMDTWQILDFAKKPELKQQLLQGQLTHLHCPQCHSLVLPMVIHDPQGQQIIFFIPDGLSLPSEILQQIQNYLGNTLMLSFDGSFPNYIRDHTLCHNFVELKTLLIDSLSTSSFESRRDSIPLSQIQPSIIELVNIQSLKRSKRFVEKHHELLRGDVDALMARLISLQKEVGPRRTLVRYRELLLRCRSQGIDKAFEFDEKHSSFSWFFLPNAFPALLKTKTWNESKCIIEKHPELLSDEANEFLSQLIHIQAEVQSKELMERYQELLSRCRKEGLSAIFDSLESAATPHIGACKQIEEISPEFLFHFVRERSRQFLSPLAKSDPERFNETLKRFSELLSPLDQALHEFLTTSSWTHQRRLLQEHPDLLSDRVDKKLDRWVASFQRQGVVEMERRTIDRRNLLRRCRKEGIEPVLSQIKSTAENKPELSDLIGDAKQLPTSLLEIIHELYLQGEEKIEELELYSVEKMTDFTNKQLAKHPDVKKKIENFFFTEPPKFPIPDSMMPFVFILLRPYAAETVGDPGQTTIDPQKVFRLANLYQWMLACINRQKSPKIWASSQNKLGGCFLAMPLDAQGYNIERAIEAFKKALDVISQKASPVVWAESMTNLAIAYMEKPSGDRGENLEKSIEFCQHALRVLNRKSAPILWERAMYELANAYCLRRRGDRAENVERAIQIYQKILEAQSNKINAAATMCSLATAYQLRVLESKSENIERAIELYNQSLQIYTFKETPIEWARTMIELAHTYNSRIQGNDDDNIEQAIDLYQQALRVRTRETMPVEWTRVLMGLGTAYQKRIQGGRSENSEQAIAIYQQILKVVSLTTDPDTWGRTMIALAICFQVRTQGDRQKNRDQAIDIYEKVLEAFTPDTEPVFVKRAAYMLGYLYFIEKQWKEAHEAFSMGITAQEMLYQSASTDLMRHIELSERKGKPFADDAYCLSKLGQFTKAIERIEANKARTLAEVLSRDTAVLEQATFEDRKAFERARNRIKSLETEVRTMGTVSHEHTQGRSFTDISSDLRIVRQKLSKIIQRIRTYAHDFMPIGLDFKSIALSATPHCPLVYLIVTSHGSLALIVCSDIQELGAEQVLWIDSFTTNDLENILVQKDDDGNVIGGYLIGQIGSVRENLRASLDFSLPILRKQLMKPLCECLIDLGFQQATLIPEDTLTLLPFHVAAIDDPITFTYAPSARTLQASLKAAGNRNKLPPVLFGIGNPLPNSSPLSFARVEVEKITLFFPEDRQCVLYEENASHATVIANISGATHLHFSCHGEFNPQQPLDSKLLLSGNDILTLRELLDGNLDLSASRLVVLSACQTGIIEFKQVPDEMIGFPAGFMQAGVPCIISTLWAVNDFSTMLLIEQFYNDHVQHDMEIPEALCQAQRKVRDLTYQKLVEYLEQASLRLHIDYTALRDLQRRAKRNPEIRPFEHPYYWAAFTCTGS